MSIDAGRREALRLGAAGLLWSGLGRARHAFADEDSGAFEASSIDDALSAMGTVIPIPSGDKPGNRRSILLTVPEWVEDGATVPISVTSLLAETSEISIFAEFNPNPLIARFSIPQGTEAFISTRVKIAQSGRVYAVVNAGGRLYSICAGTKVTMGGCGA